MSEVIRVVMELMFKVIREAAQTLSVVITTALKQTEAIRGTRIVPIAGQLTKVTQAMDGVTMITMV